MNAGHILDALDRKYGQRANNNEQWVVLREARSGAGHDGNNGQCDYLAVNTYQGRGLSVVGHEIKVSMADWRRELEDPEKAELFAQYCRRWWVVMPSALASVVRDEIPAAWGLMSVSLKGRITETKKAPARTPEEIPVWWWIGWLAQLDRRDKRSTRRPSRSPCRAEPMSYTLTRATEYLVFYQGPSESGKTARVLVYAADDVTLLGRIKWFGRWRQYAFFPAAGTVWNRGCLMQIHEEIETLMTERRLAKESIDT